MTQKKYSGFAWDNVLGGGTIMHIRTNLLSSQIITPLGIILQVKT